MVDITIFIEGGTPNLNEDALTVGSSSSFREAFSILFNNSSILKSDSITSIKIQPFGSIKNTKNKLAETRDIVSSSFFLIDLDFPKKRKQERLQNNYKNEDWSRIYFMIQEMEAWILSQPDKIELFGNNRKFVKKKSGVNISESPNLKNKVIEDIVKPSKILKIILKNYFQTRTGNNVVYSKSSDAPDLIELLDPSRLYRTFDEFQWLIDKINSIEL